jgi:hypothetical protein
LRRQASPVAPTASRIAGERTWAQTSPLLGIGLELNYSPWPGNNAFVAASATVGRLRSDLVVVIQRPNTTHRLRSWCRTLAALGQAGVVA